MFKILKKRPREPSPSITTSLTSLNEITGLQHCHNFIAPNEYSDRSLGLLLFLMRKSAGEVNFADIFDEAEKRGQLESPTEFIAFLDNIRENLKTIDASIGKCLILTRLISYIEQNQEDFIQTISDIRFDMKDKMTDNQPNQNIDYPMDFRQREVDIAKRQKVQDMRRLFDQSHTEAENPPNLIHLKNRTTEHLVYLINRMKLEPNFCKTGTVEIFKIVKSSLMITAQPHADVNPVLIYEKYKPGIYTAKVSLTIISLLHDFMQIYPDIIQFYNIEPNLLPASSDYKLTEPHSISWNIGQLRAYSNDKPQQLQYAELSSITIEQENKRDTHLHFTQILHSFKFNVKIRINLAGYSFDKTFDIPLESLQFAIGNRSTQIPQLLTRVMLTDIKPQLNDNKTLLYFMLRYFTHRTGVKPTKDLEIYLQQELTKAENARKNFRTLEDIYMDFLVPFVYQVEFMVKHPVLIMFYAEELFLGPCDSIRAADILENSPEISSPKVGLRLNTIQVDYTAIADMPVAGRIIKYNACAVRVDIYNNPAKGIKNHTFDSPILAEDICKFVSVSALPEARRIRILSNMNDKIYKSYDEFNKYYHARLHKIYKTNSKYKPITDIIDNVNSKDHDEISHDTDSNDSCISKSHSPNSIPFTTLNDNQNIDPEAASICESIPYDDHIHNEVPPQNTFAVTRQQLVQYILTDRELLTELMYHINRLNLITSPPQLNQQQAQFVYQQQPPPPPSMIVRQIPIQPVYQQPSPVMVQQFPGQTVYQQQQESPRMHFFQPNNVNQPQGCSIQCINGASQQSSTQSEVVEAFEDIYELISTNQVPLTPIDQNDSLFFDDLINDISSSQNQEQNSDIQLS